MTTYSSSRMEMAGGMSTEPPDMWGFMLVIFGMVFALAMLLNTMRVAYTHCGGVKCLIN